MIGSGGWRRPARRLECSARPASLHGDSDSGSDPPRIRPRPGTRRRLPATPDQTLEGPPDHVYRSPCTAPPCASSPGPDRQSQASRVMAAARRGGRPRTRPLVPRPFVLDATSLAMPMGLDAHAWSARLRRGEWCVRHALCQACPVHDTPGSDSGCLPVADDGASPTRRRATTPGGSVSCAPLLRSAPATPQPRLPQPRRTLSDALPSRTPAGLATRARCDLRDFGSRADRTARTACFAARFRPKGPIWVAAAILPGIALRGAGCARFPLHACSRRTLSAAQALSTRGCRPPAYSDR